MNKCCIAFITHKEKLEGNDETSFKQCINIFGNKRDIKLILPNSISTEYYEKYGNVFEIYKVNDKWLSSSIEYNAMCCKKEFWNMFADYEYVLIYQSDCWVFEDKLDYFIELRYDWYGAPWPHHGNVVGNGGLSLRKVSKMIELTTKYQYKRSDSFLGNEDTWFCLTHKNELNACPLEVAVNFSLECGIPLYKPMVDGIPMGFHGKETFIYWDSDGSKFRRI